MRRASSQFSIGRTANVFSLKGENWADALSLLITSVILWFVFGWLVGLGHRFSTGGSCLSTGRPRANVETLRFKTQKFGMYKAARLPRVFF